MSLIQQSLAMVITHAPMLAPYIAPAVVAANVVKVASAVPQALRLFQNFNILAPANQVNAGPSVAKLVQILGRSAVPRRQAIAMAAAFTLLAAGGNTERNVKDAAEILSSGIVIPAGQKPLELKA